MTSCRDSEKWLERTLAKSIKALGGKCVKLLSEIDRGLPDRLCLLPGGIVVFIEVKSKGEKPSKYQSLTHQELSRLGFDVRIIDNEESLKSLVSELQNRP